MGLGRQYHWLFQSTAPACERPCGQTRPLPQGWFQSPRVGDAAPHIIVDISSAFQSHAPRGERQHWREIARQCASGFNPRPAWGRRQLLRDYAKWVEFQSTPRVGGRRQLKSMEVLQCWFQSTPRVRGRPCGLCLSVVSQQGSIHAPAWAISALHPPCQESKVSIHAPAWATEQPAKIVWGDSVQYAPGVATD